MIPFKSFITEAKSEPIEKYRIHSDIHEDDPDYTHEHNVQNMLFGCNDHLPFGQYLHTSALIESIEQHPDNPKRLIFRVDSEKNGKGAPTGISVPKHMWEGGKGRKGEDGEPATPTKGMKIRNEMRANVYGHDHRPPLTINHMADIHKTHIAEHFKKPEDQQIKDETDAIERLHAAGHLDSRSTLDKGEKTDTVQHERDDQGRAHRAASSKGVAGHTLYTSGSGENQKHYVVNTCPGQVEGCGGGCDAHGVADTSKGGCFAPKAESQYVNAAVRRACHEQSKFDPAMTRDWALAHSHSLRRAAETADKKNERFLFRPNVVDETDRSSRHIIKGLNKQRNAKGKPPIIANSYGKTTEQHDPANDYHVTYSNTGPKVKRGMGAQGNQMTEVPHNITKDRTRVNETVHGANLNGKNLVNDDGVQTPAKNSYLVTNMKRGSDMDHSFQQYVTHAKYWSRGRAEKDIDASEKETDSNGERIKENHFDGNGKATTPDKAHYGYKTLKGSDGEERRYDYQKQHILHPRIVSLGMVTKKKKNKKTGDETTTTTEHKIPTDSRFMDNDFLPKEENRYKTKQIKNVDAKGKSKRSSHSSAGALVVTTPTTSTSDVQHHSGFNHDVTEQHIQHAKANNGEYEIDKPEDQEAARGNKHIAPQEPPKKLKNTKAAAMSEPAPSAKPSMSDAQAKMAAASAKIKSSPEYQARVAALKAKKAGG